MTRPAELHTDRLRLRPFCATDVAGARVYRDDPEFARFLPHVPQPFTLADAEAFVRLNMNEPWETSPVFAVVMDETGGVGVGGRTGTLIGTVNFEIDPVEPGDSGNRSAMLGYAIGRRWWGQGLATEAARAAVGWAIEAYGLTRLWAATDVRNVRSQRVLEKLGWRWERLRVTGIVGRDGVRVDEVVYGVEVVR